ncbi:hypothetical protein GCM10010398_17190 [Streptomyces fimbriatus]
MVVKHYPPEFTADAVALYKSRPEATIRQAVADTGRCQQLMPKAVPRAWPPPPSLSCPSPSRRLPTRQRLFPRPKPSPTCLKLSPTCLWERSPGMAVTGMPSATGTSASPRPTAATRAPKH